MTSASLPGVATPYKESHDDDKTHSSVSSSSVSRLDELRARHKNVIRSTSAELVKSKRRLAYSNSLNWYSQDFNKSGRKFFMDKLSEDKSSEQAPDNDAEPIIQKVPLHVHLQKENERLKQKLEKTESQVLRGKLSEGGIQNLNTERAILSTKLREADLRYSNLEFELNETKQALSGKEMTTSELLDEMHKMRERHDSLASQLQSRRKSMEENADTSQLPELQARISDLESTNKELLLKKIRSTRDLYVSESESNSSDSDDKLTQVQQSNMTMYRTKISITNAELTRAGMEIAKIAEELQDTQDALEEAHAEIETLRREKQLLLQKVGAHDSGNRNLRVSGTSSTSEELHSSVLLLIDDGEETDSHRFNGDDPSLDYDLTSVDPDDSSLPDDEDSDRADSDADNEFNDDERDFFLQERMKKVIFAVAIRSLSVHDVNLVNQACMFSTALLLLCGFPVLAFFSSASGLVIYLIQKDQTLSLQKDARKFFLVNCASAFAALTARMLMVQALNDLQRPLKFAFATLVREMMGIALAAFLFFQYRSEDSDPETALDIIEVKVTVLGGRGLVAKDKNLLGRNTTSDPYVKIFHANSYVGKTAIVWKTLNPEWKDQSFCIAAIPNVLDKFDVIECNIYDHDTLSTDDSMGTVYIPIPRKFNEKVLMWYPVEKGKGEDYCRNAKGDLHVEIEVQPKLSNVFKTQLRRMSSVRDITRATFRRSYQSGDNPRAKMQENGRKAQSLGGIVAPGRSSPIAEVEAAMVRI
jgi:hypothetical protein